MKPTSRPLIMIALIVSAFSVAAFARQLGSREAREAIAAALGLEKADQVRIKNISPGMAGGAVVEATVETAFRFAQDKSGKWQAVEVRTGDRRWESIELMQTAIRKEKLLRTQADLRTIATALEAFRRERGFYVAADTGAELIDNLAPRYLASIIRLDAWSQEFDYQGTPNSYRLSSRGPDQKPQTGDEIIIENGQVVKGAGQ